ncbi:MAG: hypothetical protein HYX78_10475 [Armatimonadetes bacterium]|nr:hypothetical protein [Armatimonadota bacterium]
MDNETLRRHKAFWNRQKTDRPLLGINVGFFVNQRFPRVMDRMPEGLVRPDDIPVEEFLEDCDDLYRSHSGLGDYPYVSAAFVGIPWLEAIAGCPVMASPTSFWAEHCVTNWKSHRWLESVLDNPWTKKLLELMQALVQHSSGRYGVAPTLMRGPSDILSAMRGAAELTMDLMDHADWVATAIEHAARIWTEAASAQLDFIPESDEGYVAGDAALRSWAPYKLLWLQEDAISLFSPQMYREYFMHIDRRLSSLFPCIAYHLHGSALWAIDELVQMPGVDVIEINLEAAFCDVEGTFTGWRKIQEHKPVIMWRTYDADFSTWLERVLDEFPPEGLSIQVSAFNAEDARRAEEEFFTAVEAAHKTRI